VKAGKTQRQVSHDELPLKANPDKIPYLKPVFREGGTVTAATSSAISDGAASLVLMRRSEADRRGLVPLAAIAGHATYANTPALFTTAPIAAIHRLLEGTGWALDTVDLFEISEAFAVVAMAAMRDLGLAREKVNVHGGACALGHPIGASARACLSRCLRRSKNTDCAAGSPPSASAAAKRPPWRLSASAKESLHKSATRVIFE